VTSARHDLSGLRAGLTRRTASALAVLLVTGVAACSSGSEPGTVEDGDVRIWVSTEREEGVDAAVGGTLRWLPEPRCWVFEGDELGPGVKPEETWTPVVWPPGTEIADASRPALTVPGLGEVADGDSVSGTGELAPPPADLDVPDECLGTGEVAVMSRAGGG
jgi:hypothetical protein